MGFTQADFSGDNNLGMYVRTTEKFAIAASFLSAKDVERISKNLGVQVFQSSIAGSDLPGIFVAANSNGIVLPWIIYNGELELFKNLKKIFGVNISVLKTKFTAVGNLVLCNDRGALISKVFSRQNGKKISDALGVEVHATAVAGLKTVGACGVATNKGCLLHRDAEEEEINRAEKNLGVKADIGTANFGSPFVGSCVTANSRGALIGSQTTGPEIARVMEALGFV